jgi:outer membrane protein assembly factor BamB
MFIGFAIGAVNAWQISRGRWRAASLRGAGLFLLALALLSVPAFITAQSFRPAQHVTRLWGYHGPQGDVVWAHHSSPVVGGRWLHRLAVLNAATGARGKRYPLTPPDKDIAEPAGIKILAITDDRIWLDTPSDGLHAREPYTGLYLGDKRQIAITYPQLAKTPAGDVPTGDGYVFRTHAGKDAIELVQAPAAKVAHGGTDIPLDGKSLKIGDDELLIEGSTVVRRGAVSWRAALPSAPTQAIYFADWIFVGIGGSVTALDGKTGAVKWSTPL